MKRQALMLMAGAMLALLGGCLYTETGMGPPPPPEVETVVVAPGPGYIWIGGEWAWHDRWVWTAGYWARPPHPHAVWVPGTWNKEGKVFRHMHGHWK